MLQSILRWSHWNNKSFGWRIIKMQTCGAKAGMGKKSLLVKSLGGALGKSKRWRFNKARKAVKAAESGVKHWTRGNFWGKIQEIFIIWVTNPQGFYGGGRDGCWYHQIHEDWRPQDTKVNSNIWGIIIPYLVIIIPSWRKASWKLLVGAGWDLQST